MSATRYNRLLALALCALLLPILLGASHTVERPFKHQAESCIVLDFLDYVLNGNTMIPWYIECQVGRATHLGIYASSGTGTYDMVADKSVDVSGYVTAANGDTINWQVLEQPDGSSAIVWTGGTGRFENASGSFTETSTTISEEWDEEYPWLLRICSRKVGTGTLCY